MHLMCTLCVTRHMSRRYSHSCQTLSSMSCVTFPIAVCDFFLWGFVKDNVYIPPLPKTLPKLRERINTTIGTSHKTCFRGFGRNGSIAWTSSVSHGGQTSNAFKVTMKLQTFIFQMVVTSCISVQYLWKYGFAKSSNNLYAPCTLAKGKKKVIHVQFLY